MSNPKILNGPGSAREQWLGVLSRQCESTSQSTVARRLGVSPTMINQALKGVYPGNIERLRALVEGAFIGRTVDCPVLGETPADTCVFHQERPFAATNPQRVLLFKTCPACPHNQTNRGAP